MGDVVKFQKPDLKARAEGKTLCKRGFQPLLRILRPRHSHILVQHKWQVVSERQFDVRHGKLVTLLRCARCGKEKTELR
jgi:hypothetical protein